MRVLEDSTYICNRKAKPEAIFPQIETDIIKFKCKFRYGNLKRKYLGVLDSSTE